MMQKKRKAGHENGERIFLPMSRSDIADYLGLTTETVSRTMSRFAADGLIGKSGERQILCHRTRSLIDLTEND